MESIIYTWEQKVIPTEEIELTDAQLAAVFGACGDCHSNGDHNEFHKILFEKKVKIHFEFEFQEDFEEEEFKQVWN
jgi:hypothetical protein